METQGYSWEGRGHKILYKKFCLYPGTSAYIQQAR